MTKFDQLYNSIIEEQNMLNEGKFTNSLLAGAAGLAMTGATALGLDALSKQDFSAKDNIPVRHLTVTKYAKDDIPPEPKINYIPKTKVSQPVSDNWLTDITIPFIIKYEGKILKNNKHILYDDNASSKKRKVWDGRGGQAGIDKFIKSCVGKPAIGYGSNDIELAKKGMISEEEAQSALLNEVKELNKILSNRFNPIWSQLNANQKTALISFYYNLGKYFNAPKMVKNLKAGNISAAAHEFLDCDKIKTKNGLKSISGLTRRRAEEAKLMTSFK